MTHCSRTAAWLLTISFLICSTTSAQSTFGTILGAVKDSSGAVVPNATVTIINTDDNVTREVETNKNGDFQAQNLLPAHYKVDVTGPGFQTFSATDLTLAARQMLRVDATLEIGKVAQTVTVDSSGAGVIATDTQTIQATFNSKQLLNLPGNIRANGNTSPYQLIQALPGVQSDEGGNFSIQGGLPSTTQYSLDGISITNVGGSSPLTDAFPSTESIAEIKVQGVGNAAEYGQVGDVTTISKSGTNQFHGDTFWYHQNRALDAQAFGQLEKPQKIANDYGVSMGGPVIIPHLYNGKDKTFFYGTFEGFQYPKGQTIQDRVPTQAMRDGNFNQEGVTLIDPSTNQPFTNNTIPQSRISPIAQKFLSLYPLPNAGNLNVVHDANYIDNRSANYNSNQYDIRIDQYLTSQQSMFARWTWKNVGQDSPQNLGVPSEHLTDNYKLFVVSHNYAILPNLLNEARFGFTLQGNTQTLPFDGVAFTNSLGLVGVGPNFPFNGLPELDLSNLTSLSTDRGNSTSHSQTYQFTDNLTWTKGRHTFKYGFDFRRLRATSPLGFIGGDNYGNYSFDGSFTGAPMGDFLLGLPIGTGIDNVQQDNDGRSNHYAAYAQDSWHVSAKLTLEYGARFEYHPGYTDAAGNIGNFDPSVAKSGAVIYPDGKQSLLAPAYLQSFNACPVLGSTTGPIANGAPCTPVLSASQAGLPNSLRTTSKRIMPRFGFAYRPFDNDKTVIRGGLSIYNAPLLGSVYYSLTGTLQSNTLTYTNINSQGQPIFAWPQIRTSGLGEISPYGTAYFGTANDLHMKDPYNMQWNVSIDRDLGFDTGLRVSYIAMGTRDLTWAPNLNQSYYSTTYYALQPLSSRPFPNWGVVNTRASGATANYQSLQVELNHRYKRGITFNTTYTLAKNLADNQGPNPTSFAGETAGGRTMDYYDRGAEYGDVYGTRRHRFLTSVVYDLPFGRGREFGSHMNRVVDAAFGGWQLSSIFLWQSGPYLTPTFSAGDPSGTGSGIIGRPQQPDRIAKGNLSNPTASEWFDTSAYVCPATPGWQPGTACTIGEKPGAIAPIGRFGNAGIGTVEGPGTVNVNAGLAKYFAITEHVRLKIEGSFTNVLNHVNLANPDLSIDSSSVGQITSARPADFGGNRTGQVGARLEF